MKVIITTLDSLLASVDSLPKSDHEIAHDFQPKKKNTFLASRVLLRLALKSFYCLDEVPALSFGSHGKPYFDPSLSLFFNFSHSGNYIGAAFGNCEMGFDIECVKEREKNYIFKLSDKEQREFFTLLWTVRESLLKDSGLGLVGLSKLHIDPGHNCGTASDNPTLCVHSYNIASLFPNTKEKAYFSLTQRNSDKIEFFTIENNVLSELKFLQSEREIKIN